MIRLRNVRIEKNRIYADVYPEGSDIFVTMSVREDGKDFRGETITNSLEEQYDLGKARNKLIQMALGEVEVADYTIITH